MVRDAGERGELLQRNNVTTLEASVHACAPDFVTCLENRCSEPQYSRAFSHARPSRKTSRTQGSAPRSSHSAAERGCKAQLEGARERIAWARANGKPRQCVGQANGPDCLFVGCKPRARALREHNAPRFVQTEQRGSREKTRMCHSLESQSAGGRIAKTILSGFSVEVGEAT